MTQPPPPPPQSEPTRPLDATTFLAMQRNHLANERTFLAWCRTGIAFFVFSFVSLRFDFLLRKALPLLGPVENGVRAEADSRFLGICSFLTGAMVIGLAAWRFFSIRRRIQRFEGGYTPLPDALLIMFLVVMITAMAAFLILILLA